MQTQDEGFNDPPGCGLDPKTTPFKQWREAVIESLILDLIPVTSFLITVESVHQELYDKGCLSGDAAFWLVNWNN